MLTFSAASDRQTEGCQLAFVELDLNLLLETAGNDHCGDALDALEGALDILFTEKTQSGELVRAEQPDTYDGVERWVVLEEHRQLGVERQPHPIEAVAHVEGGEIHVGVPGKLERHLGHVGA
jgi:hypothetical protein